MQVLCVLIGALLAYRTLGALGVALFDTWIDSARFAISTMFLFTAISHFAPMRKDLIAMVPRAFPRPGLIVLATGLLEVAGALGLILPATRSYAALGLIALMIAMFPANVNAARQKILLRGRAPTPLSMRLPMQILFVVWIWIVR